MNTFRSFFTFFSVFLFSLPSWAVDLSADQTTAIEGGFTSTGVAVALIIAGLIGVAVMITGLGTVLGLIKR